MSSIQTETTGKYSGNDVPSSGNKCPAIGINASRAVWRELEEVDEILPVRTSVVGFSP
jgi:hypothetical protein